jgi:hypothetical protein
MFLRLMLVALILVMAQCVDASAVSFVSAEEIVEEHGHD